MPSQVMLREGMFEKTGSGWLLLGSKCKNCSQIFFPASNICLNCAGEDTEKVELSQAGKLYTYTIVQMPAEHFKAPYAIGWLELPEGIRIFGQIRDWENNPLKVGMDMRITVEKLWEEGDDREVIGYVFRPAK